MEKTKLVRELREAGFHKEAARIASVTPEEAAYFEEWLAVTANKQRWETALAGVCDHAK